MGIYARIMTCLTEYEVKVEVGGFVLFRPASAHMGTALAFVLGLALGEVLAQFLSCERNYEGSCSLKVRLSRDHRPGTVLNYVLL